MILSTVWGELKLRGDYFGKKKPDFGIVGVPSQQIKLKSDWLETTKTTNPFCFVAKWQNSRLKGY